MKTALTPALVALGWFSLLASVPALAQNGYVYAPDAASAGSATASSTAPVAASPTAPAPTPTNQSAAVQGPQAGPAANEPTLIDNGLWEGATVGPCCALCGGGAGCPPDWYTRQGVRILSRSKTRNYPIAFLAPESGSYSAVLDNPAGAEGTQYHVVNNKPTFATSGGVTTYSNYPSQVFSSKGMNLGVAAGYDMTIGHYVCRDRNNNDHFVEFGFWGLNSWSSQKTVAGYLVPLYKVDKDYTSTMAALINEGQVTPDQATGPDKALLFRGGLRTNFPYAPIELKDANDMQRTVSLAFNNGTEYDFSYRSTMNDFEINGKFTPRGQPDRLVMQPNGTWQRQCSPATVMTYLYGLRFMQIDETFLFHSVGQGLWNNGGNFGLADTDLQTAIGDYNAYTHNSLLGLQVGADMMFQNCRWAWGFQAKAGPYLNFANQSTTLDAQAYDATTGDLTHSTANRYVANRCAASLIGEVGVQATYKFRPNLMGRASYDMMWITGLALAPDQLQFAATPVSRINTNGMIFSQGISLGLEWMR